MSIDCNRTIGKNTLASVIKNKSNIDIIENNIYNIIKKDDDFENNYKEAIYQIIGDIISDEKLKDILSNIKNGKIIWEHNHFLKVKNRIKEQDDFINNPYDIEKGVLKCNKCGSEFVRSFSKQTRGCDESSTTFAECVVCKSKWSYSG